MKKKKAIRWEWSSAYKFSLSGYDENLDDIYHWIGCGRKQGKDYEIDVERDYAYPRKQWARKDQYHYNFYIMNPKVVTELCLRWPIKKVYAPYEYLD